MLQNIPIQRKLMVIILFTSVVVMLLMCGAFLAYEVHALRQTSVRQLSTLGEIVAANSTAALAFDYPGDAREILSALGAERHVLAAGLYDRRGKLFAKYPASLSDAVFPALPEGDGCRFESSYLVDFQPVVQKDERLGTLYLRFDTKSAMDEWLGATVGIAAAVMAVIILVAYALARLLQRQISDPLLALAGTARAISERQDYSVRATKLGRDEIGLLTDAFNQMLAQIHEQNQALRRNEVQLQTIIENLGEGLAVSNLDGHLLHFNRAAIELHGFAGLEECRRHLSGFATIFELSTLDGSVLPLDQWPLARILRGEQLRDLEINIRRLNSDWRRIFNYGGTLVRDAAGQPTMAVVTITDITERKRAQEEIHQLNQELEQRVVQRTAQLEAANQELEAFSYSVSHDLRAPLRHIDGFIGLLDKHASGTLDDKSRRYLSVISDAARQMGRLIDDLLAFSRAGRTSMQITEVNQDALIAEIIRDGGFKKTNRGIEWSIAPLPRVHADPALLRQVWFNLIDNAVKYTGKTSQPRIEIGSRTDAAAGEHEFFVRDNGAGFDMQYGGKLFGVFQRLHSSSEFEGTGIGLANVHRIVARHGGRTWAEGRIGEGAVFYFSLPVPAPPAATPSTSATTPS